MPLKLIKIMLAGLLAGHLFIAIYNVTKFVVVQ